MSILFNSNETRSLQKQYQHLLVKRLAEVSSDVSAENGDHALCLLKGLLIQFIELNGRYNYEVMEIVHSLQNLSIAGDQKPKAIVGNI